MVRLLLAAIDGEEPSAVILPTELIRRGERLNGGRNGRPDSVNGRGGCRHSFGIMSEATA